MIKNIKLFHKKQPHKFITVTIKNNTIQSKQGFVPIVKTSEFVDSIIREDILEAVYNIPEPYYLK